MPIKKRKVMGLTPKNDQTLNRQPRSLKYIGNRINFVEEENILWYFDIFNYERYHSKNNQT